jgi:hypothetical protein
VSEASERVDRQRLGAENLGRGVMANAGLNSVVISSP